jgi:hypothetical protein
VLLAHQDGLSMSARGRGEERVLRGNGRRWEEMGFWKVLGREGCTGLTKMLGGGGRPIVESVAAP